MTPTLRLTGVILSIGVSVALGIGGAVVLSSSRARKPVYVSSFGLGSQQEAVAVLFVSSTCGATEDPAFPGTIGTLRRRLQNAARDGGVRPVLIGVGVDWEPGRGLETLHRLGTFDEVSSGRQWLGMGSKFGVLDPRFELAVPQLVLIDRTVVLTPHRVEVRDERVISRIIGVQQINTFVQSERFTELLESQWKRHEPEDPHFN